MYQKWLKWAIIEAMQSLIPEKPTTWKGFIADPCNLPIQRPGLYFILNVVTQKGYVGISKDVNHRLAIHASYGSPKHLRRTLKRHGKSSFFIIPLFYLTTSDITVLPQLEAQLIKDFDTIANGYNIIEVSEYTGSYGEMFKQAIVLSWTTERRNRNSEIASAQWLNPITRAQKIAGINAAFSTPTVKANQSKAAKRRYSDQAQRKAASRMATEINARPGIRERKSKALSALVWINNGLTNKRINKNLAVPNGWQLGMKSR